MTDRILEYFCGDEVVPKTVTVYGRIKTVDVVGRPGRWSVRATKVEAEHLRRLGVYLEQVNESLIRVGEQMNDFDLN